MEERQPVSDRPALDEGPQNRPPLDERAPRFDRVADELRLQPEQRRPFLELQRRHFEQVRAHRAQLEEVRGRLAQAFLSGDADRSKVEGLLEESNRRQNELDALLAQMLLESQKILTPEQQRRFAFLVLQRARGGGPGGLAGPRQGEYGRRDGARPEPPFRRRPLGGRPPNG